MIPVSATDLSWLHFLAVDYLLVTAPCARSSVEITVYFLRTFLSRVLCTGHLVFFFFFITMELLVGVFCIIIGMMHIIVIA